MREITETIIDEETGEKYDHIYPARDQDYIVVDWGSDCNGSRYTLHVTDDCFDDGCNFRTIDALGDVEGVKYRAIEEYKIKDSDKVHLHCMDDGSFIDDKDREKEFKKLFDEAFTEVKTF